MKITVSSILLMVLMGLSVVLLIVSAIFLDGVVKTRTPKELSIRDTYTTRQPIAEINSIDIHFKEYNRDYQRALNDVYKVEDINLACCALAILVAIAQVVFSALLLFKILPKLFWAIPAIICFALLVLVFGLALTYAMWIYNHNREEKWSTGRHEAFVAFVGINALFLPPTIVYVMFADKSK